jgi:hypothetical protein
MCEIGAAHVLHALDRHALGCGDATARNSVSRLPIPYRLFLP